MMFTSSAGWVYFLFGRHTDTDTVYENSLLGFGIGHNGLELEVPPAVAVPDVSSVRLLVTTFRFCGRRLRQSTISKQRKQRLKLNAWHNLDKSQNYALIFTHRTACLR